ncbi:MAG: acetylglutamate kinase [Ignavibacteria bacterium GWB2_35_6b]|nr:MAG: acetylglutamate kinase [Ignavibacteria bacterium GWB2_35_6b]
MIIIKIGGGAGINIDGAISDLAEVKEKFIIIHGANALRDELAEQLGYPKKTVTSVSGYSSVLTDEKALDIMMMAYAGLKNKRIVELCQQKGVNAVGLSGVDGKVIQSKRNKGIRVRENGKLLLLKDFSGKAFSINKELLNLLLQNNYIPVLCVPTIDENNIATNSENDDIVALLQNEFKAEKIIQLIEAPGFLEDKNNPETLVKEMSQSELEKRENEVEGRMKRKILALRKLFEGGETTVIIADGRTTNPIKDALNGKGTTIK